MDRKREKENLSLMAIFMKGILLMVNSMEKENTLSLDLVKFMKAILLRTISKDRVKSCGLMAQLMKVGSSMVNRKALEQKNGQMEATIKAHGCKI